MSIELNRRLSKFEIQMDKNHLQNDSVSLANKQYNLNFPWVFIISPVKPLKT